MCPAQPRTIGATRRDNTRGGRSLVKQTVPFSVTIVFTRCYATRRPKHGHLESREIAEERLAEKCCRKATSKQRNRSARRLSAPTGRQNATGEAEPPPGGWSATRGFPRVTRRAALRPPLHPWHSIAPSGRKTTPYKEVGSVDPTYVLPFAPGAVDRLIHRAPFGRIRGSRVC
jgi:hypothetical protein